jgi:tetratricopeptide (TPR) repeat protein
MADLSDNRGDRRLNSWKEIAGFFGKDERTVKRWENSRGLPVRRIPGGGTRNSVFAYAGELEAWLAGAPAPEPPAPAGPAAAAAPAKPSRLALAIAIVIAAVLLIGLAGLGRAILPAAPAAQPAHVPPAAARDVYLSGAFQLGTRTEDGLNRAVRDFTAALDLDPEYAAALAGLASTYNLLSQYTMLPPEETYPKGKAAAERAIALDPNLAEGYAALGFNEFYWGHHFERSAALFEKAIAIAPNSAQVLHWYALTAMHSGHFEKPMELITRAQELDPGSRTILANKALIYFYGGRVDTALDILTQLRQDHPDYLATPSYLATIYLALGRDDDFLREYAAAAEVQKNASRLEIAAAARRGLADGGANGMLAAMLEVQEREFGAGREPAFKVAATAALLGDRQHALDLLSTAIDRGEPDVLGMAIEPSFRTLHEDQRFKDLLLLVGLPAT